MALKVLYDMEQLIDAKGRGTGVVRVADKLLKILSGKEQLKIYPCVTKKERGLAEYLERAGLETLEGQKVLFLGLKKTTNRKHFYHKVRGYFLTKIYRKSYGVRVKEYDWYFSLFSPISPVVYESGVKTALFFYDLVPILYPQYSSPEFVKKFTGWVKDIKADIIFTDSESAKRDLLKYRPDIKEENVIVTLLAADKKFHEVKEERILREVRQKYGIGSEKYFLGVSELSARKNFVHLMEAFVAFLDKTGAKDIKLVLVGPMRKGYEDVTRTIEGLEKYKDRIVVTGFVDDEDMAAIYSGALGFIYPSLYEGFGLPILEAMQCGVPVISADNSSLPEVGGDAVLYISGKDVTQTAEALNKLYTDKEQRERLKEKAIKRASLFDWEKTADRVLQTLTTYQRQ